MRPSKEKLQEKKVRKHYGGEGGRGTRFAWERYECI
jgi:hypothetical protein